MIVFSFGVFLYGISKMNKIVNELSGMKADVLKGSSSRHLNGMFDSLAEKGYYTADEFPCCTNVPRFTISLRRLLQVHGYTIVNTSKVNHLFHHSDIPEHLARTLTKVGHMPLPAADEVDHD